MAGNVSYNVCPAANPVLVRFFNHYSQKIREERSQGKPLTEAKPHRTPIAERARELELKSLAQQGSGGNSFEVFTNCFAEDRRVIDKVIPLLAAAYKDKHFTIWQKYYVTEEYDYGVTIWGANEDLGLGKDRFPIEGDQLNKVAFRLELFFARDKSHIHLQKIESKNGGMGGPGLAVLYNLAKQIGFPEIRYNVMYFNDQARSFYFYYDFGRPVDEDMKKWAVSL